MKDIPSEAAPLSDETVELAEARREFPWWRTLAQMEGGSIELADSDAGVALIMDEGTLADFLEGTADEGLVRAGTVRVLRFRDGQHRNAYLRFRGWHRAGAEAELERWVRAALASAATRVEKTSKNREWPLERDLNDAVCAALRETDPKALVRSEQQLSVRDWEPGLGGTDVYAQASNDGVALLELKIDKPEETLHDIYKLLNCEVETPNTLRCSVIAAKTSTFRRLANAVEIFSVDPRDPPWIEDTNQLLSRNRKAWAWTLQGGPSPRRLPGRITIRPFFSGAMHRSEGFELRAVAVSHTLQATPIELANGWPPDFAL